MSDRTWNTIVAAFELGAIGLTLIGGSYILTYLLVMVTR